MRSGSNWCFLRGKLIGVTTRTLASGQQVAEIRLALPQGRAPHESGVTILPITTWSPEIAAMVAALPAGTTLQITGHLAARRWARADCGVRHGTEVQLDHVSIDIADMWRQADAAAAGHHAPREGD
jgi:hypothetical protein